MLASSAALAIMRCLSVCLSVMFVNSVKMNKRIFKIFHHRVVTPRVYFRPLKKGVVLALAIVKKG